MADAARHTMRTCHLLGAARRVILPIRSCARYPASIQGPGNSLLWTNVTLLLVYGLAAIWVSYQSRADVRTAIRIGAITGLLLGAVHVANHLIELFVPARNFALVISPVFLMFALLGAAGSAAWQRTRSVALAVIVRGKENAKVDRPQAGLLFFNDEGTENGGLIFGGHRDQKGDVVDSGEPFLRQVRC